MIPRLGLAYLEAAPSKLSPRFSFFNAASALLLIGTCALVSPPAARADSLADAVALAYEANPTLQSQRAQLRVTDENYVQAQAAFRPTINLTSTINQAEQPQAGIFGGTSEVTTKTGQTMFTATQNIYTGGRATAQVDVASAQIRAAREQLRGVEISLMFNVIQAYCDVIRDRASLKIQTDSLEALADALHEIRARREAGANTQTDVDQASAQVEATRALVAAAQAQAEISVAEYVAYVGRTPGELDPPPLLPDLPENVDKAFDIAEEENANIRQAKFTEAADRAKIMEARAAQRPTVSVTGSYGEASVQAPLDHHDYDHASGVSLNITQPIFMGGSTLSQIRQAIAQDSSSRLQIEAARRTAIQSVSQAWSQRHGADLSADADEAQVKVAQSTYDGMRVEYRAGLRETLDVLIAEQTLTNAQIALVNARHDEYVASASLLGAIGRLEAPILVPKTPRYHPEVFLQIVQNVGAIPWDPAAKALDKIAKPSSAPSGQNAALQSSYAP